jgi:hypothetical protein
MTEPMTTTEEQPGEVKTHRRALWNCCKDVLPDKVAHLIFWSVAIL